AILGLIGGNLLILKASDIKFVITGTTFNNITSLSLGLLKGIENTIANSLLRLNENESLQDTVKRAIPYSKPLFIAKNAPLMVISQAIDYLGSVTIPLTLLTLGAQLYSLPRSHNEHMVSIIAYVLTCRFLIMPAI
ncbi:10806_t:CDS:2, partial [Cetraspora pellucida]